MRMPPLVRLMRPGDWVKNVFVLPALVFSLPRLLASDEHETFLRMLAATATTFVAFSLLASGFYAINDALDAPSDRLHPVKRKRPVASGAVTVRLAVAFGLVLVAAALVLGFATGTGVGVVLAIYAGLQLLYNLGLKRVPIVDATVVSLGFALRAAAGAMAIDVQVSVWLLLCVYFLCLFLAFVKRLCDIAAARAAGVAGWRSAAGYDDMVELNWLLGLSAVPAVMTYLMYALSAHARVLFGVRAIGLALLVPLVLIAMHRFYRRSLLGESDSPLAALLHDRVVLVSVLLYLVGTSVTLFAPGVEPLLSTLLMVAGQEEGP
ncbi:MAG: UbiA prenyltransferase family protein [Phycisphaerales bacterium]|nr:UbiA prenyltransferase family protein [Phycisphaerales bacterium]